MKKIKALALILLSGVILALSGCGSEKAYTAKDLLSDEAGFVFSGLSYGMSSEEALKKFPEADITKTNESIDIDGEKKQKDVYDIGRIKLCGEDFHLFLQFNADALVACDFYLAGTDNMEEIYEKLCGEFGKVAELTDEPRLGKHSYSREGEVYENGIEKSAQTEKGFPSALLLAGDIKNEAENKITNIRIRLFDLNIQW